METTPNEHFPSPPSFEPGGSSDTDPATQELPQRWNYRESAADCQRHSSGEDKLGPLRQPATCWAVGPSLSTHSLMTGDRSMPLPSRFSGKRLLTSDRSKPAPPLALSRLSTDQRQMHKDFL